jgi:hypothetical protein
MDAANNNLKTLFTHYSEVARTETDLNSCKHNMKRNWQWELNSFPHICHDHSTRA